MSEQGQRTWGGKTLDDRQATRREQLIEAGGHQVPFEFEIRYDPSKIDERMSYAVQARIEDGGQLLFINDQRYVVITRGAPTEVAMMLRAASGR